MKNLVAMCMFFLAALNSVSVFAQDAAIESAPPKPERKTNFMGIDGLIGASPWYVMPADKSDEFNNLKGRMRIEGWLDITQDGCLKVKARITSGEKFNNEWVNLGVGTDDAELAVALRHIYVSAKCLKKFTIEAGAVPVTNFGTLGLSTNGSIDGLSVVYDEKQNGREWMVSAGNVDTEADVFDREFESINHLSIQVKQDIGNKVDVFGSVSMYNETLFTRAGVTLALNQYVAWLKETGIEGIVADDRYLGGVAYTRFNMGKWDTRLAYSHINADIAESDRLAFLMKQFYGYGDNYYFEISRKLSKNFATNGRVRLGDAGPLVQTGVVWNFSLKSKVPFVGHQH